MAFFGVFRFSCLRHYWAWTIHDLQIATFSLGKTMQNHYSRHLLNLLKKQGGAKLSPASAKDATIDIPPEFSPRDWLSFMLHIDAELEHSLMVQYLYAAYSLGGDHITDPTDQEMVKKPIFGCFWIDHCILMLMDFDTRIKLMNWWNGAELIQGDWPKEKLVIKLEFYMF